MPTVAHKISSLMTARPVVVDWRAGLDEARCTLQRFRFRHLPVVENGVLVGVISDEDLLRSALVLRRESSRQGAGPTSVRSMYASCPVGDIAGPRTAAVSPDDDPAAVCRLMLDDGIEALPVTRDGQLVGIVTSTDLLDHFVDLCLERGAVCDSRVKRYAHRVVTRLTLDVDVREAIDAIDPQVGHALVLCEGELVGVVSQTELRLGLLRELLADEPRPRVGDVMRNTSRPVTADSRLSRAALRMVADEVFALPVAAGGRPLGLISRTEILLHYLASL